MPDEQEVDNRVKSRLLVQLRDRALPYVTDEKLHELIQQRAPWFKCEIKELVWSAAIRFERRLASRFGRDRICLLGDAAHVALPMGIQSMNFGFREAELIASTMVEIIRQNAPPEKLDRVRKELRDEWCQLIRMADQPGPASPSADNWIGSNASRLIPCIPAFGEDLQNLLKQVGLEEADQTT
jgi:2-polyprenyl-6-methoxyphenol hydroxylase-like FAD-dependent oxidoreductase